MTEPREIRLQSWKEFPLALEQIAKDREAKTKKTGLEFRETLFRGLGNAEWKLETTLERSVDADPTETLKRYYLKASRSKPVVESLTNKVWDEIPISPEFDKLLQDPSERWLDAILSKNPSIYQYLIYLRHHGFPSPLLDWTVSPYVAAAFAFDAMDKSAEYVMIWAYIRANLQSFSNDAHLFVVGPYLRTHPRHYVQQSRYSLCVQLQVNHPHKDYKFRSHDQVLEENLNEDLKVKVLIPASERKQALMDLDSMNLNPYSLFGSEESLIRTIARREMLFKKT